MTLLENRIVLYGGTYLNKGGAAIAYGTLKVLRELGINLKYIIDPEPQFPFDVLNLSPIFRFSDTFSKNIIPSLSPFYTSKPFLNCLINSNKPEIKMLKGNTVWHIGDSPFSDKRTMLSLVGQVIALKSLDAIIRGKIIIGGVSLAYPRTRTGKYILGRFFSKDVDHLFVRGNETYSVCMKLGVPNDRISKICDFAFHLNKKETSMSKRVSAFIKESDGPTIVLILRDFSQGQQRINYIKNINNLMLRLNKLKYNIFYVPTSYSYFIPENDMIFMENVLKIDKSRIINILNFSPEEIISIFSNFDVVISTRLHGAVYGALGGVPTIHLYEDRKSLEVLGDVFSDALPLIKISDIAKGSKINDLISYIKYLLNSKEHVSYKMNYCISQAKRSSFDEIKRVFDSKANYW